MPSLSQNTFYYLIGSGVQKVFAFFYFIALARFLGPDLVGKYIFAISFAAIFMVLMDLGLNQVLIRQAAREKKEADKFFGNILSLKTIFSILVFLIIVLIIKFLNYPLITQQLVYLIALAFILENFSSTVYSFLRGYQNLKYESIGLSLYAFIVLIVGLLILYFKLPLPYLALPLIFASLFNLFFSVGMLYRVYQVKIFFGFNLQRLRSLLKITLPFFLVGVFGTIYSYIDVVLLSKLAGDKFVGFYSAGGKIPAGLRILPIAFAASLYPLASFYFKTQKDELRRVVEQVIFYLILFTLPLVFGLWILAEPAIRILYGERFLEAVPVLRILCFSIIFVFLDYVFIVLLNACGKEKKNMVNRGLVMVAIIVLNLSLIPLLKHLGSAIAFTLGFAFLAFLGGLMAWRETKFSWKNIIGKFLKILLASFLMGIVILLLKKIVPLFFLILIGAVIYLLIIWFLGLIKREEIRHLKSLIGFLKIHR